MHAREHTEEERARYRKVFAARRRRVRWVAALALLIGLPLVYSEWVPSWVFTTVVVSVWTYHARLSACPACGLRRASIFESGRCPRCDIVLDDALAAKAGPARPHGQTPALAPEYLRDDTTRQSMSVLLVVGSLGAAAPWLDSAIRRADPPYSALLHGFVVPVTVALTTAGGALYHAVRRFRQEGAFAGAVSGASGLACSYAYFTHGGSMSTSTPIFVAMLGGLIPGWLLYWLLMRRQLVTRTEREDLRRRWA